MGQALSFCDNNELEHRCQLLDAHIGTQNQKIDQLHADLTASKDLQSHLCQSVTDWQTRYKNLESKVNTMFTDPIMVEKLLVQVNHKDLDDAFERRYIQDILQEIHTWFQLE